MSFGHGTGPPVVAAMKPIVLVVAGHVTRDAVPALCAELETLLSAPGTPPVPDGAPPAPPGPVECDVGGVDRPGLAVVEAVARLALITRRSGRQLVLRRVGPELQGLLDVVGLADVVGLGEPGGAGEPGDVAEVRVPGA
ncbi:STAS domain-containing protein [Streptomyces sp. CYG20]|nr:STAS domain-containing protein [Streptomyces sp. COG21]MBT3079481.1 STAS domain-containing protein [Streptomyces sp. COG20]MBT3086694.1 STAS domain-containing protein [Streptomyces sp. CYG21]MBT3097536.1 STAS domain-containing protein [Streptomyces sp. CBG30]MBT3106653.1 STAS domain-containing protein [Streptomyces sp. COG19]MBT3108316.1 STAS domain-containing protein [Streptomyces sp. CYG20]